MEWKLNGPILDVGSGYLPSNRRYGEIAIDLHRGSCDIVADAHHLPFQAQTFVKVFARNVLEHLWNPLQALREIKRVLCDRGVVSITIPIRHNPCVDELVKLLQGFPFELPACVRRLRRWRKHRYDVGFWHVNRIQPHHIASIFPFSHVVAVRPRHALCHGRKRRYMPRDVGYLPDVYYLRAMNHA